MAEYDPARVKQIVAAALDRPPAERDAFVAGACGDNPALLGEVQSLLAAIGDASADRFLSDITTQLTEQPAITETAGTRIGPYKLLQKIGEGGFGVVFMAEQEKPVRRRVALKIIKPGMDSKQIIGRFEAERQVLALMDHPHIARVFDGGLTESQRPFFVMEYVTGDPVNAFVTAHQLNLRQRLDLFQQVCNAVQHAHTKGIIHRDLKPGNILVSMTDGKPFAKVIDFGIAKATGAAGGRLSDVTYFTEHRQLIGTPEYMSPEQVEGSPDIDTRTDVYALGVLLYELLTGLTPFDRRRLRSAALAEMQRIIKEEDPIAPSVRVMKVLTTERQSDEATEGEKAGTERRSDAATEREDRLGMSLPSPASLRRSVASSLSAKAIRGELDWIVLKALEKDRARRYESASQLAADVARHLAGEPVVAAPPSIAYRVRKFVKKHRTAVATTGMVAATLCLGLGTTTWQWRVAQSERMRAEAHMQLARESADRAIARERDAAASARFAESVRAESQRRRFIEFDRLQELEAAAQRQQPSHAEPAPTSTDSVEIATPNAFRSEYADLPLVDAIKVTIDRATASLPSAEHHFVAVYAGYDQIDDLLVGPRAEICVDRPGETVVLWLSTHDPVSWYVTATPSTKVSAVLLVRPGRQRVCTRIAGLTVYDVNVDGPCQITEDDPNTNPNVDSLESRVRAPLRSFTRIHQPSPRTPIVVDGRNPPLRTASDAIEPRAIEGLPDLRFQIVTATQGDSKSRQLREFSLTGPTVAPSLKLNGNYRAVAIDNQRSRILGNDGQSLLLESDSDAKSLDSGFDVPQPSWLAAVAFDSKRDRFLAACFGGDGFLYAIDSNLKWTVLRTFHNVNELTALTYDARRDIFYGLCYNSNQIFTLNSEGEVVAQFPLSGRIAPGALGYWDTQLVCVDGYLIGVNTLETRSKKHNSSSNSTIHLIDPETGVAELTARGNW